MGSLGRAAAVVTLLGLVAGALVGVASPAGAITLTPLTVDNAGDGAAVPTNCAPVPVAGQCRLRDAFAAASTGGADASIDVVINITAGLGPFSLSTGNVLTYDGGTGFGHSLTINGSGGTATIAQKAGATQGVIASTSTGTVTLENVSIRGGNSSGDGGGIKAAGPVSVTASTVMTNTASGQGGGIHSAAGITVSSSTISGNTSATGGGGFWAEGAVNVTASTISANTENGTFGGGGFRANSTTAQATITGSTVSGNTAGPGGIGGGGIAATGPTTITDSTIAANTAGAFGGGGIAIGVPGTVTLVYATVVNNTAPATCVLGTCGTNVSGSGGTGRLVSFGSVVALPQGGGANCKQLSGTTSNGFNLSDDTSCGFTTVTDKQGAGNPGLGPLVNNGGPTQTLLPQPGSPLIDAIPIASCQADGAAGITADQRGLPRPSGPGCDIGAVEVQAPIVLTPRFTG